MNKSYYHEEYKHIPDPRRKRAGELPLKEQRMNESAQAKRDELNAHNFTIIIDDVPSEVL